MLKRYWFIFYPQDKYGPRNIGVTAHSSTEGKQLIADAFVRLNWTHIAQVEIDNAEVIENINLDLLDKAHVMPNIGAVTIKGLWFPRLNL